MQSDFFVSAEVRDARAISMLISSYLETAGMRRGTGLRGLQECYRITCSLYGPVTPAVVIVHLIIRPRLKHSAGALPGRELWKSSNALWRFAYFLRYTFFLQFWITFALCQIANKRIRWNNSLLSFNILSLYSLSATNISRTRSLNFLISFLMHFLRILVYSHLSRYI